MIAAAVVSVVILLTLVLCFVWPPFAQAIGWPFKENNRRWGLLLLITAASTITFFLMPWGDSSMVEDLKTGHGLLNRALTAHGYDQYTIAPVPIRATPLMSWGMWFFVLSLAWLNVLLYGIIAYTDEIASSIGNIKRWLTLRSQRTAEQGAQRAEGQAPHVPPPSPGDHAPLGLSKWLFPIWIVVEALEWLTSIRLHK